MKRYSETLLSSPKVNPNQEIPLQQWIPIPPPHKHNTRPKKEVALEPKRAARPPPTPSDTIHPINLGILSNPKEFPDNLNKHSTSKTSTCMLHTPKDETKGRNVTEKNEKNNSLNENQNVEENLSTQIKPH